MPPKEVIWKADAHTLAKIDIVKEYLKAWFPIIGRYNPRIIYIDGFCGPGQYIGGEKGSPVTALETALSHHHDFLKNTELIFVFNDKDEKRIEHLSSIISEYDIPKNYRIEFYSGNFKETLLSILDSVESKGKELAPTFLFVDPFGIKENSYELIKRFMKHSRCEVLINFMSESINRFASTPEFENHLNELYGSKVWKTCLDDGNKYDCLVSLYESRLKEFAEFCWPFEMKDTKNKTKYLLFFISNHLKGLEKMKDAMWKIDPSGDYLFSARDCDQLTIFDNDFDPTALKKTYQDCLGEKLLTVEEIEEYTISQTSFRKSHVRKALTLLEKDGLIEVRRPGTRGYPMGTIIKFL